MPAHRSPLVPMLLSLLTLAGAAQTLPARAATPGELLSSYATQAGRDAQAARGQQLFTTRHGREWSCSSCHGERPVASGRHASTARPIDPLAPAAHRARFTDAAKTEKWFRRNCNDVLARECTAAEKADVLAWLITLTP